MNPPSDPYTHYAIEKAKRAERDEAARRQLEADIEALRVLLVPETRKGGRPRSIKLGRMKRDPLDIFA